MLLFWRRIVDIVGVIIVDRSSTISSSITKDLEKNGRNLHSQGIDKISMK